MENTTNFAKNPDVMAAVVDLMATAMEINRRDGVQIWVDFVGHVNWLEIRAAVGAYQNAVELTGPKYLNFDCNSYGDDAIELANMEQKHLKELIAGIEDKKQQLIALGARYGDLTDEQIAAMSEAELEAKQIKMLDEAIESVEKKLEQMKAQRQAKAGAV